MNIGVSAWRLHGQRLGIGRYIEYLLKYWNESLDPTEHVTIYVHEPLLAGSPKLSERFTTRLVRPKLTNWLWENLLLPSHAGNLDVLFCPSYTAPLIYAGKSVVVIHSVDEAQSGTHHWWYPYTWGQKYRLSAHKADRIITGDQTTKERLVEVYRIPEGKVDVVSLGVDQAFAPLDDQELLRATRETYMGDDRPYILFAGGLSRRRNVPTLMKAFSIVKQRRKIPHGLLLLGPNRANHPIQAMASELGIADSVVHSDVAFTDHRDLVPIYNAADLFVLPSSSEGFSLTLLEAMACGTPAITVNRAGLGVIAAGYAYTIDEPAVEPLSNAIERVLFDSCLRSTLRARELERAQSFSWNRTADATLDVLRRVGRA
jgi:glycosyltransferase involved in cell wall biosynthesis